MRYLCILFLFCAVTCYSQTFYSPVICKLTLRVDDGVRFWGIPGTGSMVTIDADGYLSRGYAGAATVTGLVPTEVLFGKSDGTIDQDPDFYYDESSWLLSLTGTTPVVFVTDGGTDYATHEKNSFGVASATHTSGLFADKLELFVGAAGTSIFRQSGGSSYNINLPNATGTPGQALRLTAGLNLEWFTPSGGSGTVTSIATTSPVLGGTITTTGTISLAGLSGLGTAGQMTRTNAGATAWEYFTPTFLTAAVTSFSFTDAHGFDGTVTNATTTPSLELITTVTDNQILYSTGGDITGSPLFTWDDATNNEIFDATVFDFLVRGTSTYGILGFISDAGNIQFGDISNSVNSTLLTVDDGAENIVISADNGVLINYLTGSDNLLYGENGTGKITAVTLTANDFNFSAPTLSIDYANGQSASTSTKGFLTDTDWDTFNDKTGRIGTPVSLTGQTAAIGATTAYTLPAADGYYRVSFTLTLTTAATSSSQIGFQCRYTNATDNVVKTSPNINDVTRTAGNSKAVAVTYTYFVHAKASTNIQYIANYSSTGATAAVYDLSVVVEKVN